MAKMIKNKVSFQIFQPVEKEIHAWLEKHSSVDQTLFMRDTIQTVFT